MRHFGTHSYFTCKGVYMCETYGNLDTGIIDYVPVY